MSLEEDLAALSTIPLFNILGPDALRLIAFSGETRILRAGDVLFRKGEPSDGGFVVLSGSIALDTTDHGGAARQIVIPHALIGEIAIIAQTERPATAIAREPSTVLRVTRALFHRVLKEYPGGTLRLRDMIETRLKGFLRELDTARIERFGGSPQGS
jgi:CRP-like cAMP-binding protein